MIKLLIFDVGGVLDTFDENQYVSYISKKLNLNSKEFTVTLKPLLDKMEVGRMDLKDVKRMLAKKFCVTEKSLEWESAFRKLNSVNTDVVSLVNRLSKRYKIAILTNVSRTRHEIKMETYLKEVRHDAIFVSCYLRMHKPEHKIYRFALGKMNIKPNEAVFIDNLKINVKAAEDLGIRGIVFKNYKDLVKGLGALGIR